MGENFFSIIKNNDLKKCTIPENLTVITWNNLPEKSFLEIQFEKLKIPLTVLGKYTKWETNRLKPLKFLEHSFNTKYVLALDAFDVKIIRDLKDILIKFLKFNCEVLYNATSTIYPECESDRIIEENMIKEPFCFFNSGAFIGNVNSIKKLYNTIDYNNPEFPKSDQFLIRKLYQKNTGEVKIDFTSEIFQIPPVHGKAFDFINLEKLYL